MTLRFTNKPQYNVWLISDEIGFVGTIRRKASRWVLRMKGEAPTEVFKATSFGQAKRVAYQKYQHNIVTRAEY